MAMVEAAETLSNPNLPSGGVIKANLSLSRVLHPRGMKQDSKMMFLSSTAISIADHWRISSDVLAMLRDKLLRQSAQWMLDSPHLLSIYMLL